MVRSLTRVARKAETRSRHLQWESFEARIEAGPPSAEPIKGSPRIQHFIEAGGRRIGARFFVSSVSKIPSPLAEVLIREVRIGSKAALEVSTGNRLLFRDFYALCCAIADRVQIEGQSVSAAVATTLDAWAALIRQRSLLSTDTQTGLVGELLFLRRVAKHLGWEKAAASWLGPNSEEHDFVLPLVDVEVKSTTREQRVHRIASLTQLRPKSGRRLQLVSIQLTLAGENGFSLPAMVASILTAAGRASSRAADLVRSQIRSQGWEDEDAPNYTRLLCLRAPIMTAAVSENFPAITPATLDSLGQEAASRIDRVSYMTNVDGLGMLDGTAQFDRVLFGKSKK
jgi:hypothetical protein